MGGSLLMSDTVNGIAVDMTNAAHHILRGDYVVCPAEPVEIVLQISPVLKKLYCSTWTGRYLVKRFCQQFYESSPCLPGQQGSCRTVELSENILQDLLPK